MIQDKRFGPDRVAPPPADANDAERLEAALAKAEQYRDAGYTRSVAAEAAALWADIGHRADDLYLRLKAEESA